MDHQRRVCPVLRLVLEKASGPGGITSLELARLRHLTIATASSRLGRYAARGYLEVRERDDDEPRGRYEPLTYEITPCGQDRLAVINDLPPDPHLFDFSPLLACWGRLLRGGNVG